MTCAGSLAAMAGVLVAMWTATAGAAVRYVDDDAAAGGDGRSWATAYDSLSTALTEAQGGDQVWVAAGTYVGNFTLARNVEVYGGFAGTETELSQRDWTANPTILNGNATGSVVTAPAGATATTRIDGFTIINGSGTESESDKYGGGLYLSDSSPTVANNTIRDNTAHYGGALYLLNSSATITNNTITGNSASGRGGLYLHYSSATITNNRITANGAVYGGGLALDFSSPEIANNTITANSASYGGGLFLHSSHPTISNNTITGNGAYKRGGGLDLRSSSPTIANTIIAFNSSGICHYGTTLTLRYNCVYGNTEYDYSGLTDPTGRDGNISADPRLADPPYGNVHIEPGSPCVDAGSNTDGLGNIDLDGEPRIQPAGGTIDIGADESDGATWGPGPYVIVRVSQLGNDAHDGSSWALTKRTVQAGIDAASAAGGEVWVQAGTYQECITLKPYAYVYAGFAGGETVRDEREWDANVTTLEGQQQGSVVTALPGYRVSAIDGFTIANGREDHGGGLYLNRSSPTIANNTITGNSAGEDGGGLYAYESSPTIANNRITDNSADWGGGLYLYGASPIIANNTITGNSAGEDGGGLYVYESSPTIANNRIADNSAYYGCGGGLYLYGASPIIANNTVTGNAGEAGGGLYVQESSATITNNRVTGNVACHSDDINGVGGGIYLWRSSAIIANNTITGNLACFTGGGVLVGGFMFSLTIQNNTLMGNSADVGGGLYVSTLQSDTTIANTLIAFNSSGVYADLPYGDTPTMRSNCVYGNTEYDYSGLTDPTGTNGNISADPLLADLQYGNVHIQPESPCVDAGSNVDTFGEVDLDGEPRIHPPGGTVDIGVDESGGTVWAPGPNVIVRVSLAGDDTEDGSSWSLTRRTVQAGIDAASALGGEVWVQAGTYEECITLRPYAYVYGGFAGGETARDERDWNGNVTTLDGQQQGSVVTARGGGRFATIDGFTITNGSGTQSTTIPCGGGFYLSHSSPTIANNTIAGNTASWGGGLFLEYSASTIANNAITGNSAGIEGGGLYLVFSSPTIVNSTIAGNRTWWGGGGLQLDGRSSPMISTTIIAFNGRGICRRDGYGTPTLRYNCVYGNGNDYCNLADPTGTEGNISADPRFIRNPNPDRNDWSDDPSTPDVDEGAIEDFGDLRLSVGSPCIDAGDNAAVPGDMLDMDGDGDTNEPLPFDLAGWPRFVDDPLTPDTGNPGVLGGPVVDMGAYEYQLPGDCDRNGQVNLSDFAGLAECMGGPDFDVPPDCDCPDANLDGHVDLRDFASHQLHITAE